MPIKIDDQLPAHHSLELENIFVMTNDRASRQDIRPLKIILLNLMPTKIETETQILRLLSNTPLQVEVELLQVKTHTSKNTSQAHMLQFYKTFDDIKNQKFDGMIVTGAPVELLDFEEVDYWDELCMIYDWAATHVYSTFNICWGAQAALYYKYGVPKHLLDEKTVRSICTIRCCVAFPMCFMCRIRAIRKHARKILHRSRICSCFPIPTAQACIWCLIWNAAIFSARGTANMTATRWRANISAMCKKGWTSKCPKTISPTTTRKRLRSSLGAVRAVCCSKTG